MTSRELRILAVGALLALVGAAGALFTATAGQAMVARGLDAVDAIAITVSDVDRAADFYSRVLFFERVSETTVSGPEWDALFGVASVRARTVTMRLGDERIELTQFLGAPGRPLPAGSRSHDHWFQHIAVIVSDMDQAYAWLRRHRVDHISPSPQRLPDWNPKAGGIEAFYFRDPDGHPLEILRFPPDKGDARWRRPTGRVFLGIDHTAIVVSDTARSVRFYRDVLGMRVAGESDNHGPEQERLSNVRGAHLRITTLRAATGPGVELLEYVAPTDGRASAGEMRATDLAAGRTIGTSSAPRALLGELTTAGVAAERRQLLLRDPDGHLVHVRSR